MDKFVSFVKNHKIGSSVIALATGFSLIFGLYTSFTDRYDNYCEKITSLRIPEYILDRSIVSCYPPLSYTIVYQDSIETSGFSSLFSDYIYIYKIYIGNLSGNDINNLSISVNIPDSVSFYMGNIGEDGNILSQITSNNGQAFFKIKDIKSLTTSGKYIVIYSDQSLSDSNIILFVDHDKFKAYPLTNIQFERSGFESIRKNRQVFI